MLKQHRRLTSVLSLSTVMLGTLAIASLASPAQDTATATKDGKAPAKSAPVSAKRGGAPAATTVTMTLKLYNGASTPFLTATRDVTKGINAFDALRKAVNVEFTTFVPNLDSTPPFPGGPFVDSLAGIPSAPPRYWMLYVDGSPSKVGIGAIKLDKNILIEWKLE